VPTIWLLGSSDYSARLAAEKGLPYVFAHHFAGRGTAEALELYRSAFRPSGEPGALTEPRTFLTVNACVAETEEEAERLVRPQLLSMLALRTGAPLRPQLLVEEAEKVEIPEAHRGLVDAMRGKWVVGTPDQARTRLTQLATAYDVDEVMVNPVSGAYSGTDPATAPNREQTLRLLAG
jgi:luciferase family oxidoreductase group 1